MPTASKQGHKKNWGAAAQHGLARKEDLGNTNTPMDVARMIVAFTLRPRLAALAASGKQGAWLEPAVGTGNFYLAVLEEAVAAGLDPLDFASRFHAIDIDAEAIAVLRARLASTFGWDAATIASLPIACTSLAGYAPAQAFDAIITNPPYLAPRNWSTNPEARVAMRAKWSSAVPGLDARADLYLYFFHWANRHLAPGGESVFLCADGWLDASFGASLRAELSSREWTLREIRSWPWKPLFRDDTCPVVTVVQRSMPPASLPTHLVQDDTDPLSESPDPVYAAHAGLAPVSNARLASADLAAWLGPETANRRQRLVTPPALWDRLEGALALLASRTVPLDSVATPTSFGWSLADFERAGLLLAQPGATGRKDADDTPPDAAAWAAGTPIFFQKQARVGKPVDYAIARSGRTLGCRLAAATPDAADLHARARRAARHGGVWLSLAIDRMPLLFVPEDQPDGEAWVGVSKYVHLAPAAAEAFRNQPAANVLLAASMLSTPSLLWMDRHLKEGTRKTLRRGENGYAKEVRVPDVCALQIPDPARLAGAAPEIVSSLRRLATRSVSRMEVLLADPDWLRLDDTIAEAMGIAAPRRAALRRLVLALYWRRMRNVANYGQAASACVADPVPAITA